MHIVNDDFSIKDRFFEIDGKQYEYIAAISESNGFKLRLKETIDTIRTPQGNLINRTRLKMYNLTRKN